MARCMAWLALPVAALVVVWAAAGCRRVTPKSVNEVRDEGRQQTASYERQSGQAGSAARPAGSQEAHAVQQEREEAAGKIRDDQAADAKVREEYKIDDETGQPKEEPGDE